MDKYFKPYSLTWWASAAPLFGGVIVAIGAAFPGLQPLVSVVNELSGGMTSAALINLGLIGIGLRGAMQ